jgi:hypothetical protein
MNRRTVKDSQLRQSAREHCTTEFAQAVLTLGCRLTSSLVPRTTAPLRKTSIAARLVPLTNLQIISSLKSTWNQVCRSSQRVHYLTVVGAIEQVE